MQCRIGNVVHMRAMLLVTLLAFAASLVPAGAVTQPRQKSSTASEVKKCKKGEIWNKKKKKCIQTGSGLIPDGDLIEQASVLAETGHYDWAIEVLDVAQDDSDPALLGLLGYCHRKAGRLETGISYYRRALAIAPDMVRVREYLGEGYAMAGRLELARAQLKEIAVRCGTQCEEYRDLNSAIGRASSP